MQTWSIAPESHSGLVPAIAAAKALRGIGTSEFARGLLDAVREGVPASYCSVLMASRKHGAQMMGGASVDGKDVLCAGREYLKREYYRRERNGLLAGELGNGGRISLQQRSEVSSEWRSCCYDPYGIAERCSMVVRSGEDEWISVNFYRRHDEPRFRPQDLQWLKVFAPIIVSSAMKHRSLSQQLAQLSPQQRLNDLCAALSGRERAVVLAACQALTNKEIARQLNIEVSTVVTYRQRAYQRLGVQTQSDLVRMLLSPSAA